jgi:acyl-CoA synthetase (AMP-forming)/AMP-acid ligase II
VRHVKQETNAVTLPDHIPAPGERFNFAQHLLQLNAAHAERPAFVDDHGVLSYGALAEGVARLAAGLRSLGLKREERVLLLMLDSPPTTTHTCWSTRARKPCWYPAHYCRR